jgi:hypothetical protein
MNLTSQHRTGTKVLAHWYKSTTKNRQHRSRRFFCCFLSTSVSQAHNGVNGRLGSYGTWLDAYGTELGLYGTELGAYGAELGAYGTQLGSYGTELGVIAHVKPERFA